jgi:hypothetical protein
MPSAYTAYQFDIRSRTSEKKFLSVYHVSSVSYDNILMWMCEILTILHEGEFLRMNIFALCSCEMALNVGLNVLFVNTL